MKNAPEPIHIESGQGTLLFDVKGNSYIDAISSWWTNIHGHAHPYIAQKMFEQQQKLEHVIFAGFTHTPALELASRLIQNHLPKSVHKIFYSDNGSTAVEVALKMAVQYWYNIGNAKKKIIAFENAYHGDTFGSMSVSERGAFTKPFHNYLFDVIFIPIPKKGEEETSYQAMKAACTNNDVAGFIYEPLIQGAGGMLMYQPEALNNLLHIAKQHEVICIADEVMTGFYRTGKIFASDYILIKPDIICLSKGITGGTIALGATACAQFIFDAFYHTDKMKALYHGHSFTANPLACTASLASLDIIEETNFILKVENIVSKHKQFTEQLQKHGNFENIRMHGTIIAFDLKTDSNTNYFNNQRETLYQYFMQRGILLRPLGNTLYIMPPYCITDEELQKVYTAILSY